jgi:hypothetical protein
MMCSAMASDAAVIQLFENVSVVMFLSREKPETP